MGQLAEPKKYHPDFKPDRPSVYWPDKDPESKGAEEASERIQALAQPRERKDKDIRNAEWPVSESAKSAVASGRIAQLAQHKAFSPHYNMPRVVRSAAAAVNPAAKEAKASNRVCELAKPRRTYEKDYEPKWGAVEEGALKADASQRVQQLSQPKPIPQEYQMVRNAIWQPSEGAMKATPTQRTLQLSKAKKRNALCPKPTCAAAVPQSYYMMARPM